MRGLPDDFSGDEVERYMYMKNNYTYGLSAGVSLELFGKKWLRGSAGIGVNYNNYNGVGIESELQANGFVSGTSTFNTKYLKKVSKSVGGSIGGGLSLKSSSKDGFSIRPDVGINGVLDLGSIQKLGIRFSPGISVSTEYNTRRGLESIVFSHSLSIKGGFKGAATSRSLLNGGSTISFSSPSYTPTMNMVTNNTAFSFALKIGPETKGAHTFPYLKGYYSEQDVPATKTTTPAFGYIYLEKAKGTSSLMDFNREKDGEFSEDNPNLALPIQTYDFLNVAGQGMSSMIRPFRSDIGILRDPETVSRTNGGNIASEYGAGLGDFKFGTNVATERSEVKVGEWSEFSNALKFSMGYREGKDNPNPLYESVYFKQVGEKNAVNESFIPYKYLDETLKPQLQQNGDIISTSPTTLESVNIAGGVVQRPFQSNEVIDDTRTKRNQVIQIRTAGEANYCLEKGITYYLADNTKKTTSRVYAIRKAHHISEISVTNPGGARYVYGIPAYNITQEDFNFTNAPEGEYEPPTRKECLTGLVEYDEDILFSNPNLKGRKFKGINHFFSATKTPAYAHSYLLTAVLSPDYVDLNGNGPDDVDNGTWHKFEYYKLNGHQNENGLNPYKWRVPVAKELANLNEGNKSDKYDDGASILYGEKEVWMIKKIEGKEHVALFYISAREDALGVTDLKGGFKDGQENLVGARSYKLDSIEVYVKSDMQNPVKKIFFEYDYSLCPKVENNSGKAIKKDGTPATGDEINNPSININHAKGKLTLKRIYFAYGSLNAVKGRINSYVFAYNSFNPDYNMKAYDRWGNYKEVSAPTQCEIDEEDDENSPHKYYTYGVLPYNNSDFPYTVQDARTDEYAAAWSLTDITLPSGGKINITYESDDYAYVQDQQAMNMVKIVGFGESDDVNSIDNKLYKEAVPFGNPEKQFVYTFFELPQNDYLQYKTLSDFLLDPNNNQSYDYAKYEAYKASVRKALIGNAETIYYNAFVDLAKPDATDAYEYIRGHGEVDDVGLASSGIGYVRFKLNGGIHPIARSAMQFARLYMPELVYSGSNLKKSATGKDVAASVIRGLLGFLVEGIESIEGAADGRGVYGELIDREQCMTVKFDEDTNNPENVSDETRSFLRINNLNGKKKGGGVRVKKITMADNWANMGGTEATESLYGQEYDYTIEEDFNGTKQIISSGVAAYEPIVGGDENPLRKPIVYNKEKLGVPSEEFYLEEPFFEPLYPAPTVGYRQVSVRNLPYKEENETVTRHATGKTVYQFYTAKEFPVFSKSSKVDVKEVDPDYIFSFTESYDEKCLTATQGYQIELNDMHGKPRSVAHFSEPNANSLNPQDAFSVVEYKYYEEPGKHKLNNEVPVVSRDNSVREAIIGVEAEMVFDSREMYNKSYSISRPFNLDAVNIGIIFLPIMMIWPDASTSINTFRSMVLARSVYRYGILKETIVRDEGSVISTQNVLFDEVTGEVLVSKTKNEFDDDVFNTTIPVHFVDDYLNMGPAYENSDALIPIVAKAQDNLAMKFFEII